METFFFWVLRASWQAAVLAVGILILRRLFGASLRPRWRAALWLLLLVRLVAPALPGGSAPLSTALPPTPEPVRQVLTAAPLPTRSEAAPTQAPTRSFTLSQMATAGWVLGMFCFGGWGLWVNLRFTRALRREGRPVAPTALADECAKEVGLKRLPPIYQTRLVATPALYGCLRPRLLLPAGLELTQEEWRFVYLHEFTHLRRGDLFTNTLLFLLQTLHWFNPLLWYAFACMRQDAELATDAAVLAGNRTTLRRPYGETLIRLAEGAAPLPAAYRLASVINTARTLRQRLRHLRAAEAPASRWLPAGVAALLLLGAVAVAQHAQAPSSSSKQPDATALYLEGTKLTSTQAEELEKAIAQGAPDAITLRQKLLGYYADFDKGNAKRNELVLWFIENEPEVEAAGHAWVNPMQNPTFYRTAAAAWEAQIVRHPRNLAILGNAANFHIISNRNRSRELLEKAYALDPRNPDWPDRLAQLHQLESKFTPFQTPAYKREQSRIALRYRIEMLSMVNAETRYRKLGDAALLALRAGERTTASAYAQELLNTAPRYRKSWIYGNAIFEGHSILGEVALDEGNLPLALEHLRMSGKTPGSPQLDSGGADLTLANRLLAQGERDAVLAFLDEISRFWKNSEKLDYFREEVKEGRTPDLTGSYPPSRFPSF